MLSPVPIAPQNIQKMRDWAQTFGVAVRQMAKAGTLPSYLDQGEIQLCEPVSFEISDFKEQQKKNKKKKQKNRRRRKWDIRVQFPSSDEEYYESFPDNETAWDDGSSIFEARDSFSPRKIFPAWEEVFASTAELCSIDFSLFLFPWKQCDCRHLFCFMHLLKLLFVSLMLTCLCYYVFPRPKFNGRKSLPWLANVIRAKLWKLLKWTISMGEKR